MKLLNYSYTNPKDLINFIEKNNIKNSKNTLIQVFQSNGNQNDIEVLIEEACKNACEFKFYGHNAYIVTSTFDKSMIGHYMLNNFENCEIAIICSLKIHDGEPKILVSLRSKGNADVAVMAEKHFGGGHKNAAGFEVSLEEFAKWRKQK